MLQASCCCLLDVFVDGAIVSECSDWQDPADEKRSVTKIGWHPEGPTKIVGSCALDLGLLETRGLATSRRLVLFLQAISRSFSGLLFSERGGRAAFVGLDHQPSRPWEVLEPAIPADDGRDAYGLLHLGRGGAQRAAHRAQA